MERAQELLTRAWPSVWRDLNVFIAAFAAMASLGSFIMVVPVSLLLKLVVPAQRAELIAYPLGYAMMALGLIYWWWKHGLSPRQRNPARERRFRWGHVLLAIFNTTFLVMLFAASSLGRLSWLPHVPAVAGIFVSLMGLAPMGVIVGLVMVLSARGAAPEFADTLPWAQGDPMLAQPAKLSPRKPWDKPEEKPPLSSGTPSSILVVTGLLVSTPMLYMATIFGALGFQGNTSLFTGTVLPIVIAMYVLYVSTGIFLLTRRRNSAVWVAWAPVGLFTVGLPALQVIQLLFSYLFGR